MISYKVFDEIFHHFKKDNLINYTFLFQNVAQKIKNVHEQRRINKTVKVFEKKEYSIYHHSFANNYIGIMIDENGIETFFYIKNKKPTSINSFNKEKIQSNQITKEKFKQYNNYIYEISIKDVKSACFDAFYRHLNDSKIDLSFLTNKEKKVVLENNNERFAYEQYFGRKVYQFEKRFLNGFFKRENTSNFYNKVLFSKTNKDVRLLSIKISGGTGKCALMSKTSNELDNKDYKKTAYIVDNYPMLSSLFLRDVEGYPNYEKKIGNRFNSFWTHNMDFIESVKLFFRLTDNEMDKIKNINWQKATPFKNRPILLINIIKSGVDTSKLKHREDYTTLYYYHYYLLNNPLIEIKDDNFNRLQGIRINKKIYSIIKTQINTAHTNSIGDELFSFEKNKFFNPIEIDDFKRFYVAVGLSYHFDSSFRLFNDFEMKGAKVVFSKFDGAIEVYYDHNFVAHLYIDLIDDKGIELSYDGLEDEDDENIIEDIISKITLEYKKLFNCRYQKLEIVRRLEFFGYLHEFLGSKQVEKYRRYFFFRGDIRGSVENDAFRGLFCNDISFFGYNTKKQNLLDYI